MRTCLTVLSLLSLAACASAPAQEGSPLMPSTSPPTSYATGAHATGDVIWLQPDGYDHYRHDPGYTYDYCSQVYVETGELVGVECDEQKDE